MERKKKSYTTHIQKKKNTLCFPVRSFYLHGARWYCRSYIAQFVVNFNMNERFVENMLSHWIENNTHNLALFMAHNGWGFNDFIVFWDLIPCTTKHHFPMFDRTFKMVDFFYLIHIPQLIPWSILNQDHTFRQL